MFKSIKSLFQSKSFWFFYMFLFGISLLIALSSDMIPSSIVEVTTDIGQMAINQCDYGWFRGVLRCIAITHLLGG